MSSTHFKVLLKKNYLTLKRKWGFMACFILLPITSMFLFAYLKHLLDNGVTPEKHNFESNYSIFNISL